MVLADLSTSKNTKQNMCLCDSENKQPCAGLTFFFLQ